MEILRFYASSVKNAPRWLAERRCQNEPNTEVDWNLLKFDFKNFYKIIEVGSFWQSARWQLPILAVTWQFKKGWESLGRVSRHFKKAAIFFQISNSALLYLWYDIFSRNNR